MSFTSYNINEQITSVRLASSSNISGFYFNGISNNGVGSTLTSLSNSLLIVDGINAENGDRIFLFSQNNSNENGIYDVINSGSYFSKWSLKRSNDFQSLEQLKPGQFFSVSAGRTLSGNMFALIEPLPSQIGIGEILIVNITGSSTGGPFLTVDNNLSDVNNKLLSYQNIGLGNSYINLSNSDFIGSEYHIINPAYIYIDASATAPVTIFLPDTQQQNSITQGQSIEIYNYGSNTITVKSFSGSTTFNTIPIQGAFKYILEDNATSDGDWVFKPVTYSVDGQSGNIDIANVVQSWNGSTSPVNVTAGPGMNITDGVISGVIKSWNGSTNPIDVTAGTGIDITDGQISLTGTGPSSGYGVYFGRNPVLGYLNFTDTSTWKIISIPLKLDSNSQNIVVGNDSYGTFLQNSGTENSAFLLNFDLYLARYTNSTANGYYLSPFISNDGVSAPIVYNGNSDICPFGVRTQNTGPTDNSGFSVLSYTNILTVPASAKIYMAIQNNGSTNPNNNDLTLDTGSILLTKVGDVGGTTAGVSSLNGLTGDLNVTSSGSSLTITSSGNNINIDVSSPLSIARGGTNSTSQTTNGINYFNGSSITSFPALTNGQILIGSTGAAPIAATITPGIGITIASAGGIIIVSATGNGPYTELTTSSGIVSNHQYTANSSSLIVMPLPSTSSVGDYIKINYKGTGGWSISQSAGQQIQYGTRVTTSGTGGSLSSSAAGDCVTLICITSNILWQVQSSQGNLTIV